MNSPMRQIHTNVEDRHDYQGGREGGMDQEFGVSRCKLLCIDWINNKILLYSMGNSIQYPMINHNGKEYLKSECMFITESLCSTAEMNTALSINYTSIKIN